MRGGDNQTKTLNYTMIKKLIIKNTATFDDKGVEISDLKKVNFFYGANGSGKTTISNFIYDPKKEEFSDCDLDGDKLKALVYNKEFRNRNFGKGTIPGVFTLGEESKELNEKIDGKKSQLDELNDELTQTEEALEEKNNAKTNLEENFKNFVWKKIYKKYETYFKNAFTGFMGSMDDFYRKLLREAKENSSSLKTYEELKERAKTIFGKRREEMGDISTIQYSKLDEIEKDKIWSKKIIGKDDVGIAKLIQKLGISDWVNNGRSYLSKDETTCPFCQKDTIDKNFRDQLEEYFDESFTTDTQKIEELKDEYVDSFGKLIEQLQQIKDVKEKSKLDLDKFESSLKLLSIQFNKNKELLNNKLKEPSRGIELTSTKEQLDEVSRIINAANAAIKEHNDVVNNYNNKKDELIKEIWKFLVEDNRTKIDDFNKNQSEVASEIEDLKNEIEKLNGNIKQVETDIKELTKKTTSVQPSVDAINNMLKSFEFQNFKIVTDKENENQYQIQRENGDLAKETLSEGEETFITFLYFLQLAKGSANNAEVINDRILVIDDPISSLDSNVLFLVSTLVKEIVEDLNTVNNEGKIKQLILLTHNVYFHKDVSFKSKKKNTYYGILSKNNNVSSLQRFEDNPIQNSYELLWKELKNENNLSHITIQNTMRKIIENYFKIIGGFGDKDIIAKFSTPEEKQTCTSLMSWVNEGSHTISDDLYVEQPNTVDKYSEVFKSIFEKTGHLAHYEMMMNRKE